MDDDEEPEVELTERGFWSVIMAIFFVIGIFAGLVTCCHLKISTRTPEVERVYE